MIHSRSQRKLGKVVGAFGVEQKDAISMFGTLGVEQKDMVSVFGAFGVEQKDRVNETCKQEPRRGVRLRVKGRTQRRYYGIAKSHRTL